MGSIGWPVDATDYNKLSNKWETRELNQLVELLQSSTTAVWLKKTPLHLYSWQCCTIKWSITQLVVVYFMFAYLLFNNQRAKQYDNGSFTTPKQTPQYQYWYRLIDTTCQDCSSQFRKIKANIMQYDSLTIVYWIFPFCSKFKRASNTTVITWQCSSKRHIVILTLLYRYCISS
jgi:hypothetical protein